MCLYIIFYGLLATSIKYVLGVRAVLDQAIDKEMSLLDILAYVNLSVKQPIRDPR